MAGGKRGKTKAPFSSSTPRAKRPTTGEAVTVDVIKHEPLSWRFGRIDLDGRWGWRKLAATDVPHLLLQMTATERETLVHLERKALASEIPTSDICLDAQQRLPRIGLEDTETIWELRLPHKKWRAWGVIQGATFYLVWWDPDHTVCQRLPKGTPRRGKR